MSRVYPINNGMGVRESNQKLAFANSVEVYTSFSSDIDLSSVKPKAIEVTVGIGQTITVVDLFDNEKSITVPYDGYIVKCFVKTIKSTTDVSEVVIYYDQ